MVSVGKRRRWWGEPLKTHQRDIIHGVHHHNHGHLLCACTEHDRPMIVYSKGYGLAQDGASVYDRVYKIRTRAEIQFFMLSVDGVSSPWPPLYLSVLSCPWSSWMRTCWLAGWLAGRQAGRLAGWLARYDEEMIRKWWGNDEEMMRKW